MTEYTKWQCEVEARLSELEERCGLRGAIKPEDLNLEGQTEGER